MAEKVEEPEPVRAGQRTTRRAVWVGLFLGCVFGGECCLWFVLCFWNGFG